MSNALLAMSGPAFGNMDITVYDVYTITSTTNVSGESNAIVVFSGRSWTWALVDISRGGLIIPRPFVVDNSVSITNHVYTLSTIGSSTAGAALYLYGTSTSLKGGINSGSWTITAYVPST